ncbi:MAG: DUF4093 domain-containing protein [Oscillospiraceae bacterium]|nr:DUF4093 domain-containing protein [Oscillospiraceae bacterium]MBQ3048349.1 DUF4093 domain-containing protein [Oscillospiraceae bacterium]MBQ9938638.1 DUF4093 domain-containing protein [Oscillospiraceae bacterium]
MYKVSQAIVVEGKYDKIKLASLVDATVIQTDGFQIFKDKELLAMLRLLADKKGLVVLTDSDAAGFKIRGYINSAIAKEKVIHAYIPDIHGKEKRKAAPGKEGKLGVEGVPAECIIEALKRAGVLEEAGEQSKAAAMTKADMWELGLSGGTDSSEKRRKLCERLSLPQRLSANALLTVLNSITTKEELEELLK